MCSPVVLHFPGCERQAVKMKKQNLSYFNFVIPGDHVNFLCLKFKTVQTARNISSLGARFTLCMKYFTKLIINILFSRLYIAIYCSF